MDDTSPATKADVSIILQSINELRGDLKETRKQLREADDEILTVLVNVDKRLTKKVENHERRLVRLERQAA